MHTPMACMLACPREGEHEEGMRVYAFVGNRMIYNLGVRFSARALRPGDNDMVGGSDHPSACEGGASKPP